MIKLKWKTYCKNFETKARKQGLSEEEIKICLEYASKLFDKKVPIIYDHNHLSFLVGIKTEYLFAASNKPEHFYRSFKIPKKSGGFRSISEPLPTLKKIQRWILDEILSHISVSKYAKAYVPGQGIKGNARFHRGQSKVLSIDLKDFFGSIKSTEVYIVFRSIGYSKAVSSMLTHLCCLNNKLPQGSPTSPALSNLVMRRFDTRIGAFAYKNSIRYTRYADDMTFSGSFDPGMIIRFLEKILSKSGFAINHKKTRVRTSAQRQEVSGIVVNEKMQVPEELRKRIRQETYYIQKYGLDGHLSYKEITTPNYLRHLIGLASHALHVNPSDSELNRDLDYLKGLLVLRNKME